MTSPRPHLKLQKKKFFDFDCHQLYWVAFMVSTGVAGWIETGHFFRFGMGFSLGVAYQMFLNRNLEKLRDRRFAQDMRDLETLSDLSGKMSYRMLHQKDKSGLN